MDTDNIIFKIEYYPTQEKLKILIIKVIEKSINQLLSHQQQQQYDIFVKIKSLQLVLEKHQFRQQIYNLKKRKPYNFMSINQVESQFFQQGNILQNQLLIIRKQLTCSHPNKQVKILKQKLQKSKGKNIKYLKDKCIRSIIIKFMNAQSISKFSFSYLNQKYQNQGLLQLYDTLGPHSFSLTLTILNHKKKILKNVIDSNIDHQNQLMKKILSTLQQTLNIKELFDRFLQLTQTVKSKQLHQTLLDLNLVLRGAWCSEKNNNKLGNDNKSSRTNNSYLELDSLISDQEISQFCLQQIRDVQLLQIDEQNTQSL